MQQHIRHWQYTQLENNLKSVASIVHMSDPQVLNTYRDGGSGWTVLEVLCHLRDFEQIFLQRAIVTMEQDHGALPFPKPDDLAVENRYGEQQIETVLSQWQDNRAQTLAYLKARVEEDWERIGVHPTRGNLTLMDQLCLIALHDTIHMEQMTRVLCEKKLP